MHRLYHFQHTLCVHVHAVPLHVKEGFYHLAFTSKQICCKNLMTYRRMLNAVFSEAKKPGRGVLAVAYFKTCSRPHTSEHPYTHGAYYYPSIKTVATTVFSNLYRLTCWTCVGLLKTETWAVGTSDPCSKNHDGIFLTCLLILQ